MPVFFLKQGSRKLQDALPGFIEPLIAGQSIGSELGGRFDRGITELGRVFFIFILNPEECFHLLILFCAFLNESFMINQLYGTRKLREFY